MADEDKAALERLAEMALGVAAENGFQSLGSLGDRHGSWEISFCKHAATAGELNRFVWLAFTGIHGSWDVELWAGADDNNGFVRRLVSQYKVKADYIDSETARQYILEDLERAIEVASGLQRSDLLESYLPSRRRARRG